MNANNRMLQSLILEYKNEIFAQPKLCHHYKLIWEVLIQ